MKKRSYLLLAVVVLLALLPAAALANGSIRPWLLGIQNEKWGPVPADRLQTDVFGTNGNIVSKYHAQTGVLYHSYHGNPDKHVITDKTFTNVIIHPPKGAEAWMEFYYEGISLTQKQDEVRHLDKEKTLVNIWDTIEKPKPEWLRNFDKGFPYYEWALPLFKRPGGEKCTPLQQAAQGRGNLYLTAWYTAGGELLRVDWVVETSDTFSVPRHDIQAAGFPTYASESDLPDVITQPSLINPPSPENVQFRLMLYYYPSYRGNTDFAELLLMDPDNNIIPNFDQPVVIYWPYPEGLDEHSPVHYQLKHYLDNTRTEFEMLHVTPTQKGLRIVTNSFSPFELTWNEIPAPPGTGDDTRLLLWLALCLLSGAAAAWLYGKKGGKRTC
ncbi:MAG: hypothetical protein IJ354_08085 [Clostridia bacterium]|nr:hypothetical protein [Clostridia bacterium]